MKKNNKGFTMVEILVTVAIFSIAGTIAFNYLISGLRTYSIIANSTAATDSMSGATSLFTELLIDNQHGVHVDNNTLVLFEKEIAHFFIFEEDKKYVTHQTMQWEKRDDAFVLLVGAASQKSMVVELDEFNFTLNVDEDTGNIITINMVFTIEKDGMTLTGKDWVLMRNRPVKVGNIVLE